MRTNITWVCLLLFLSFVAGSLPATSALAIADSAVVNQPKIQVRYPDPQKLKAFRENKEFQYIVDVQPSFSWWDRFWFKLGQWQNKLGANQAYADFWRYLSYVLAVGIILYAVLKLLQVDFVGLFSRRSTQINIPYETHSENIHEINFETLIAEAEKQGDYRRAIRLYYLHILKNMADKSLIQWNPSKTNQSYVREISSANLRRAFGQITTSFEFVWYGGTALSESRFQVIRQTIQEFNQLVRNKA